MAKTNLRVRRHMALIGIVALAALAISAVSILRSRPAQAASANDVIINEVMYNPSSGNQNDEFLELYNTTGSTINLENWSFSNGIVLTFPNGVTIPSNGYIVISPSIAQTSVTYGVTAVAQYTGNLSNGGETLTLLDETAAIVNEVTYDDIGPWPVSPDGSGPSLELKSVLLDNSLPASWSASSSNGGTPTLQNSLVGLSLPVITGVNDPNDITAAQAVVITATVTGSPSSVELAYKLNFAADVTLTMFDDGAHGDGGAADNVYGATIPGQAVDTLVRFRVDATNGSGTMSAPGINDSIDYYGYYVKDPSVTSNAPILEWFMSDVDYTDMVTNHRYDNLYIPTVIVYGNDVYDSARIRVRGEDRAGDKMSLKVKLPSSYTIDLAGGSAIAIDEFELLRNLYDMSSLLPTLNWMASQTGLPTADMLPVRLQRNGDFHGLFMFANKYQKEWRAATGYNNGELYEDSNEIVSGADTLARVTALYNSAYSIADINTPAQKEYVLDSFDIPKTFNFMATIGLVSGWDHATDSNNLQFFDTATERWSSLIWDQEGIYPNRIALSAYTGRGNRIAFCWSYCPVYNQPELRVLYMRRFRTLADKLYTTDALLNKFNEIEALHTADLALDKAKWDGHNSQSISGIRGSYAQHKEYILSYGRSSWGIPAAQTQAEREAVFLDEVIPNSDNTQEYIKLSSTAITPVDISGWTIEGINYTIPAGAVVPANGSIYLLRDDIGYRASHSAVLVAGQYSTDLGSSGSLTLKTDANVTIDTYAY